MCYTGLTRVAKVSVGMCDEKEDDSLDLVTQLSLGDNVLREITNATSQEILWFKL